MPIESINQFFPHSVKQIAQKSQAEVDYIAQIEFLQTAMKKERAKATALRSKRADGYAKQSGLEEFFLQCNFYHEKCHKIFLSLPVILHISP